MTIVGDANLTRICWSKFFCSGLVAERKDLFDALHSHGRDAATAAAHLGAQLQTGLKGNRQELEHLKQGE